MLDYIIINSAISPIEANYFIVNNTFEKFTETSTGGKTTELKSEGIIDVNIWFNLTKMISEPLTEPYCSINATIDVQKLKDDNLDDLFKLIEKHLPTSPSKIYNFKKLNDLEWKIKSASFVYNFTGTAIETYYKMLSGGYDLPKCKLEKKISKTITTSNAKYSNGILENRVNLTEYAGIRKESSKNHHESVHLGIELKQQFISNDDGKIERKINGIDHEILYTTERKFYDKLQFKIQARRNKIRSICYTKDNNGNAFIPNRDAKIFLEKKDEIDKKLFIDYITLIVGDGNYYKYINAEKIIESDTSITKKKKDKMCNVLKAVGSYKGISNYLEHVEDKEPVYESMKTTRKREYALVLLRDIQKLGIYPLTIPIRAEQDNLPNLISVYQSSFSTEIKASTQNPIIEAPICSSESTSDSNQYEDLLPLEEEEAFFE